MTMESSIAFPVFESDNPAGRPVEIIADTKAFNDSPKILEDTFIEDVLRRNDTKGTRTKVRPSYTL